MEELSESWLEQQDHERMKAWMERNGWQSNQWDDPLEILLSEEDDSDFTFETK